MSARAAWAAALLWAGALLALGSIPNLPGPESQLPLDKAAHLVLYGVLGALAGGAWRKRRRPHPVLVVGLLLLVGAADEINQSRIAGRSAEAADWIMDAVGITGAFWLRTRRAPPPEREPGE